VGLRSVTLLVVLLAALLVATGAWAKAFDATLHDGQLDLRADEAPLISVLEAIAEQGNLELQVYGDEHPTVTGVLQNVPLEAAFERLLRDNYMVMFDDSSRIVGLVAVLKSGAVMLGGDPALASEPTEEDEAEETVPAALEAEIQKLHRDFSRELLSRTQAQGTSGPPPAEVRVVQEELKERLDDLRRQLQDSLRRRP
jgi:hypothetical protein